MPIWDSFLTERDRAVFAKSGYGRRGGLGLRPAVLVIDVVIGFVGEKPEGILDSIDRWYNSCGAEGWSAIANIERLIAAARSAGVPIVFSQPAEPRGDGFDVGRWADKNSRLAEDRQPESARASEIPAEIAPRAQDIVVRSTKPSIFFGTLLLSQLIDLGVDSLLVAGTTTSGCVRATVVDAFSYNFFVNVIQECTFDRGQASHAINLFDMDQKYADVVSLAAACDYLATVPRDLYDPRVTSVVSVSSRPPQMTSTSTRRGEPEPRARHRH